MLETLKNLFAVVDLRNRVLFTLGMLAVYRVGNHIPTPGVNSDALRILAEQAQNTLFGMYDMFTGGSLSRITIFALGVMPYISSSIILQLLTVVWPPSSASRKKANWAAARSRICRLTLLLGSCSRSASRSISSARRHAAACRWSTTGLGVPPPAC